MIVSDIAESVKLQRARVQPNLSFTPFALEVVAQSVRNRCFPEIKRHIECFFVERGPLACIEIPVSPGVPVVYFHNILNHQETPLEVIGLICKHELLHMLIPPREVDGRKKDHPPELWDSEKAIAPERTICWLWININLGIYLKRRPRLERMDVLPGWRKLAFMPRLTLKECADRFPGTKFPDPEKGGW